MKTFKNLFFLFSLVSLFALQSCEHREDLTESLYDPLDSTSSYICKFNAIMLDDVKSGRRGNGFSYLIDGELKGYSLTSRNLVFEANYKRGVLDGPLKRYFGHNGALSGLLNLSNGLREGEYKGYVFYTEWVGTNNMIRQRVVSGNYRQDKMDGEWKINNKDGSIVAVFKFDGGDNLSLIGKWMSSSGYLFEFLRGGHYKMSINGQEPTSGVYTLEDDMLVFKLDENKKASYYRISSYDAGVLTIQGTPNPHSTNELYTQRYDDNEYTMTRLPQ
ncbi:MAG: hypothetical protein IM631_13265 [Cytophagales bacterium]|nr:hypothetical protein [Cytophagales bacterium]MCA6372343.1 hypothetical protein [Cytophagales bacterium]MCA6382489.1 hypothetical protein [Cytophagales bacterium]